MTCFGVVIDQASCSGYHDIGVGGSTSWPLNLTAVISGMYVSIKRCWTASACLNQLAIELILKELGS